MRLGDHAPLRRPHGIRRIRRAGPPLPGAPPVMTLEWPECAERDGSGLGWRDGGRVYQGSLAT